MNVWVDSSACYKWMACPHLVVAFCVRFLIVVVCHAKYNGCETKRNETKLHVSPKCSLLIATPDFNKWRWRYLSEISRVGCCCCWLSTDALHRLSDGNLKRDSSLFIRVGLSSGRRHLRYTTIRPDAQCYFAARLCAECVQGNLG